VLFVQPVELEQAYLLEMTFINVVFAVQNTFARWKNDIKRSNFQKVQFSKGPIFKRSNFQKVQFSKGPIFKRSNFQGGLLMEGHPCQCVNGNWEPYDDDKIVWSLSWPHQPETIIEYTVCMRCNTSWRTLWFVPSSTLEPVIDRVEFAD